eukprot:gnl/TRDRNA2_/TRDRNA2_69810_c0_seq1.p1 gnl/TRDRNA2_/TRDRNA2_69810_c0~~gnl/TRDRNA2_/TRDRNA2_69810_c0_seq1.p1  ORF type:complete len:193 (-),score=31.71 gnl/TRDRNA2_/TRDRNA2_69810_c0_seq1:95-673(-)
MAVSKMRQGLAATALLAMVALTMVGCGFGDMPKCAGKIQSDLRFGCKSDYSMANQICCHNTDFAEPSGYFQTLPNGGLFAELDKHGVTTFYDAVCGLPLFRAPIGRSFEDWKAESEEHGWPSFRQKEVVWENVQAPRLDGEVRSKCGVHLGHNIPDFSGNRYCIDLVCIAGQPAKNVTRELVEDSDQRVIFQ